MAVSDRQKEAWSAFLDQLSPSAAGALSGAEPPPPPDEGDSEFSAWASRLSDGATRDAITAAAADARPEPAAQRYGLVESPDGDWSQLKMFRTLEALAERIGALDGEDVIVWMLRGTRVRLTRGPQRYLIDGDVAVAVPYVRGMAPKILDASLVTAEEQDDGYLGPDDLSHSEPSPSRVKAKAKATAPHVAAAEEDEDEDDPAA